MKSHIVALIVFMVVASNIIPGCTEDSKDDGNKEPFIPADDSMATPEGVMSIVNGSNEFAFDLFALLKEIDTFEGNVFLSPYSISVAMGLLYEGTKGLTAEEIQTVFQFPEDDITRLSAFARLYNLLNGNDPEYELSTANSMWYREGVQIVEEYRNRTERYYMAEPHSFISAGSAMDDINNWVEDETNDRIKDIIKPGMIDGSTEVVGVNALYFKGDWTYEFDPEETHDREFKAGPGKNVTVPIMYQEGTFNYTWTPEMEVLELPYKGDDLSMLIFLPHDDSPDAIDDLVNASTIADIRDDLHEADLEIFIPKFEFETRYELKFPLITLGMPTAFEPGADLSGMLELGGAWIKFVVHQTYVNVDEKGTEAAAATVWGTTRGGGPPEFRADHPFMFVIQHKETGAILFLGKVVDPSFGIEET